MKLSELIWALQTIQNKEGDDKDIEIAVDDGTDKSPIPIKSTSQLMNGYLLFLTYE